MDPLFNSTSNLEYHFTWYDYTGFSIMLGLSALIGIYFGFYKGQSTAKEYLLGGKEMNVIPIAVSLTASNVSGITLLAVPTDVYRFGANYWIYCINMFPIAYITYYVYLPVFYELQLTSTYEYLKLRFSGKIRILASLLYTISNLFYLPIVIYIPALAFSQATGVNLHLITPVVCGVCIFYTTIGGLKAVVWTDTLQFVVMIGSIIGVFYMGILSVDGFQNMWAKSVEGKRLDFLDLNLDPTERDTFVATLIGTLFGCLSYVSVSQGFVQKYLSMPTMNDVKKALFLFAIGMIIIISFSVITGLIMYARYSTCDPFSAGKITRQDQILPYYVMDVAGTIPGLAGLFMSGIFSAALSTLSANMNCLAGSIYEDFVSPFVSKKVSAKSVSNILKLIVFIIGIVSTALVFVIERMGSILPIQFSLAGITSGPLLGIFSLGILFPIANSKGALCGGVGSILIMSVMIIGSQIYKAKGFIGDIPKPLSVEGCLSPYSFANQTQTFLEDDVFEVHWFFRITYYYYTFIGTMLVILIGIPVSYLTSHKNDPIVSSSLISPVSRWMINFGERNKNYLEVKIAAEKLVHNK